MNTRWFSGLRGAPVLTRGAILFGGAVLCGIPTLWWAGSHSGSRGVGAASTAAGLCLTGAMLALPFSAWTNDPKRMLPGLLLGIGIRSGIPLGGGIGLYLTHSLLAEAGLLYYLVVFYFPLWALETYMSLPNPGNHIPPRHPSGHRLRQAGHRTTSKDND